VQKQNLLKNIGIGRLVSTNNEKKQSNNDSVCMMQDGTTQDNYVGFFRLVILHKTNVGGT
jgi:hypothetical protein